MVTEETEVPKEKNLSKDKKLILLITGATLLFLLASSLFFYFYLRSAKGPPVATTPKPPEERTKKANKKPPESSQGNNKTAQKSSSNEDNPTDVAKPQTENNKDKEAFASYEYKDPFQPLVGTETAPPASTQTTETQNQRLALEDITEEAGVKFASVKYGGVAYKVKEGDRVDESPYQVISVGDNSVTLLYGDEQVSVQLGQEIIK